VTNAVDALVDSLRGQIVERTKAQQQLVLVSVAVAGATLSFASELLSEHPEVMALLCVLYVGISLALLRHDQEITIMAALLLNPDAVGQHARVQAYWEAHKFVQMQRGTAALVKSGAQTAGNYGVPVLGVVATGAATLITVPNVAASVALVVAAALAGLFLYGAEDVRQRYKRLGTTAQALLAETEATTQGDAGAPTRSEPLR